jgi:hypothetical protein
MSQTPKLGESWYIFDDASGECSVVKINDITENTVQLLLEDGTLKRFYTEYINFADKVIDKVVH